MRAAVIEQSGGSPVVRESPDPTRGRAQALIQVRAAALNPIDLAIASGRFYQGEPSTPYVPGCEGIGVIRESDRFPPGTVVRFEQRAGYGLDGGLADLVVVDERDLIAIPIDRDPANAASVGIAALAGWISLEWRAALIVGETVIVLAASGALGQVAVQSARILGADRVVAAARSADGLQLASDLGADAVVKLHDSESVDSLARRFTAACGRGADVIIDPLWGIPAAAAIRAAATGARLVNVGRSAGAEIAIGSATLTRRQLSVLGQSNVHTPADITRTAFLKLLDLVEGSRIRIPAETFSLNQIGEAWRLQASSPHRKLIVIV